MGFCGIGHAPRARQYVLEIFEANVRQHESDDTAHLPAPPLHCGIGRSILRTMNDSNTKSRVEIELKQLEKRLEDLISSVAQMKEENRALRQRQETLTAERAGLLQKNEQVRGRVEAMIGRLKSMEQA